MSESIEEEQINYKPLNLSLGYNSLSSSALVYDDFFSEVKDDAFNSPRAAPLVEQSFEVPLAQISEQFKDTRRAISKKFQKEKETEILGTLIARQNKVDELKFDGAASISQWDNQFLMRVVCTLTLSGFISGFDIGAVSLISLLLDNNKILYFDAEYIAIGTFVAMGSFGAAVGALLAGPSVDKFGRK